MSHEENINQLADRIHDLEVSVSKLSVTVSKLRATQIRSRVYKLIYLGIILVSGIVLYYYLQPFYETLGNVYNWGSNSDSEASSSVESSTNLDDIQQLINMIQGSQN